MLIAYLDRYFMSSVPPQSPSFLRRIFTRENLIALALCAVIIAIIILTADASPQWIYQGF